MEEQRKISDFLDQIPQPGFLVSNGRIRQVNQAAAAMLLTAGQPILPLLKTGTEEYTALQDGQLNLVLTIAGHDHDAIVLPEGDCHLFLLDQEEDAAEFRSMALVSMEFRGPLMQAINSTRQLESDDPAAAKVSRSLMQMLRMVCNMSDISHYRSSARMEVRDVDAFLLELFEKAGTLAGEHITISYEGLKQPLFVPVDPEQLERAVWNLLSNCLKFMPQEGSVQASLTRRGRMLHLTVQDTGSGIHEAVRATLFRRYLRQPGIEDSRYGLGLGLAIVRTAAANHGGTVLIGSTPEGGTRVTMTISIDREMETVLHSPLLRLDYTGGWDHGLVELSDCLGTESFRD